jgi:putative oxidoreductase
MHNSSINNAAQLLGRILLAVIFIRSGWGKISGYETTSAYMGKAGVPGSLLPLVIIVELLGGLLIVIGWQTRLAAVALAGFCLLSAYFFHFDFGNQAQAIQFMKNVAIAGGFLVLAGSGPGAWSVDGRNMT